MRNTSVLLLVVLLAWLGAPALTAQETSGLQVAPRPLGMPGWTVTEEAPLGLRETFTRSGQFFFDHLKALAPGQTSAIWIGLIATLVLAFDWRRRFSGRNVVILLLFLPALLFFDLDRQSGAFGDIVAWSRFRVITLAIMALQVAGMIWALMSRGRSEARESMLPTRALRALAFLFLGLVLTTALVGEGADSSIYTNFGAQRLRERGLLPYGDPWLDRGTATAYGPAIYLMIVPAQVALDPKPLNAADDLPAVYVRSRGMPVRLTVCILCLISFIGLVALGRGLGGRDFGWTLAALVFSSPYVIGVGSDESTLVGAMNISDIAPMAFMILAFVWLLRRPFLSGLALGQATACGFFPILLAPVMAFWLWRQERRPLGFLLGYALIGAAYLAFVLLATESHRGDGPIRVFLDCTFGIQTRANDAAAMRVGYGDSPFGFWGSHPEWRDQVLGRPGTDSQKPWAWVFLAVVLAAALLRARRADLRVLLASCGALALAVQLPRLHASGVHVMWYLPFMLAALLAPPEVAAERDPESSRTTIMPVDDPTEAAREAAR